MALVQLEASGASGTYVLMTGNTADPHSSNACASMQRYYFVGRRDGFAASADLVAVSAGGADNLLARTPAALKPDGLVPFDVRRERLAFMVQRAWRTSISDPRYALCRKRLRREFAELAADLNLNLNR